MPESIKNELLRLNEKLLESINVGDWETYAEICDPTLTAFEPEARGHLVEGLEFHRYYFGLEKSSQPVNNTISSPHVRLLRDDVAIVSYVRLVQSLDHRGRTQTSSFDETRVWQRHDGHWRHVHFHRSENGKTRR